VVGVYDAMPQMVWTCNFLKEQGVGDGGTKLLQDNMSAMLLEKNGRASSSKRTKHMDIRYFFIKDRIASGDITLEHCPTESMLADFFTKPLQGSLFYQLRDQIMNVDRNSKYHSSRRSVLRSAGTGDDDVIPEGAVASDDERSTCIADDETNEWTVVKKRRGRTDKAK
jgi:hypothetical protein